MLRASLRLAWRSIKRLPRIVLISTVLMLFAGAGLLLALRYWVLPDIGRYHGDITAMASRAIGQPVIIGKIEADWSGFRPHLLFTDVRILDKQGQTALVLPRVDNELSWMTLLTGDVRLYSLEFDQPDLLIQRDPQGLLHIAGVALASEMSGQITGQAADADWLLRQARIVVRDARVTWQDERRAAPSLVLSKVNLVIENSRSIESFGFFKNSGYRHSFALHAQPPAGLSGELDVRGDFYGDSFDDLNAWSGQLFTQLDYVDVAAWRAWLSLPAALKRGKGALRGWLGIADGKFDQFTGDLALADVQTRLAEDLPPLDLLTLRGRVAWRDVAQGFEISTRKLSLHLNTGLEIPPTDFYLRLAGARDQQAATGEMRANTLELANLAGLTDFLPLDAKLKQQLAEFAPQGVVSDLQAKWQGDADELLHYEVKAQFDEMSMRRAGKLPGFSGLSGYVNGSDAGGILSLNARNMTVDAPQIMPEPLAFDTLTAQGGWQLNEQGLEVKFNNVFVANEDLAGNLFGSYQALPQSRGSIDLTVHLTRAAVRQTARYIPLAALDSKAHDWLRNALLGGQSDEFRLRLRGNLDDFPFDGNRKGIFQIQTRATGVVLEYGKEWPRLENGIAELLINGKRLEVTAPTAMTVGGHLQKISVVLPDIVSPDLLLLVRGEALSETQHSLDFIRKSPVRGYIDGFTDGMMARGKGKLTLQVDVPLSGDKPAKVSGSYHFLDNDLSIGGGVPTLMNTNGDLLFTESSLHTRNAVAQILGGSATLQVRSGASGAVSVKASGRANIEELRKSMSQPLLLYLQGDSLWEAEITVVKKQVDMLFTSDLVGLASDLPAPFFKRATEPMPLRFEKKAVAAQQDMLSLQYGNVLEANLLCTGSNGNFNVVRGLVSFGNPGNWPARDGIWLSGAVPMLSLQGWEPLFSASDGSPLMNIGGIDLRIQKISGYGYKADDLRITARNRNNVLFTQLSSNAISGEVRWHPQGNGKLVARMKNISLDKDEKSKEKSGRNAEIVNQPDARTAFPALDLVVDSITLNGKHLGKLELQAQQQERDWQLDNMLLTNPDGVLKADGKWQMGAGSEQTQLNLKLEISNAGNVLARSGYPNSVKQGSGKLEGVFSWQGGPAEFSYAELDGSLKLNTGKGQFLQIDPGAGKLLSILSLQSLPKHITLDFADVFSKGFAFDSITGTAQINKGVLTTGDFKIEGSAAKVTMLGQVDLNNETQNLLVRILPTVGDSISLLGAFAAGPAVGVGVYLANKLLREPLDKLASFEYNVTGTWADPNVKKAGDSKPPAPPEN